MEEMFTTRPHRFFIMYGSAARVQRNVPVSMTPINWFHLSGGNS